MEKRLWLELKRSVLELLETSSVTSEDVANELGCKVNNASMCLLKLFRQGLVDREMMFLGKRRKPPYVYVLTDRGRARLEYYRGREARRA